MAVLHLIPHLVLSSNLAQWSPMETKPLQSTDEPINLTYQDLWDRLPVDSLSLPEEMDQNHEYFKMVLEESTRLWENMELARLLANTVENQKRMDYLGQKRVKDGKFNTNDEAKWLAAVDTEVVDAQTNAIKAESLFRRWDGLKRQYEQRQMIINSKLKMQLQGYS